MEDHCRILLEDFLKNSWSSIEVLVKGLVPFKDKQLHRKITLFNCLDGKKTSVPIEGNHFFLRGSVEYANPQVTVEEIQGIVGTRLLEVCANYFDKYGLHAPNSGDIVRLCELLKKPPQGYIVPFLLNTDDIEPDRYSMNPLKRSIIESGQSAFPVANVKTDGLRVDEEFVKKYEGKLISKQEAEVIGDSLQESNGSYLDWVDCIKYSQLTELSEFFGMDLFLYTLRMPLSTLKEENKDGLIHYIISESHSDYSAVNEAYSCMGRSMTKRTTLLTVPHSKKGYGSKRAARGRLHFEENKLQDVTVRYKPTKLYPNGIDPSDIAMAVADDSFTVSGEKLSHYDFAETPSSPQFSLYSMGSPEDAALWHGVGAFAAPQLLQSYSSARIACRDGRLIRNLSQKYDIEVTVPLQFNLTPEGMWWHPNYRNIDASIGSVENLADLVYRGMRLEYLSAFK